MGLFDNILPGRRHKAQLDDALRASIIDDVYTRLAQSYASGLGTPAAGFPDRYFEVSQYTGGASLFQIRASRYYSIEDSTSVAYHSTIGSSVLGGVGLQLETEDDVVNDAFNDWSQNMESTGLQDWTAFQYEVLLHITRDGECMIQPIVADGELRFSLLDVTKCARASRIEPAASMTVWSTTPTIVRWLTIFARTR